jgi:uncharacterized DUF497 family protein
LVLGCRTGGFDRRTGFAKALGVPEWECRAVFGTTRLDYDPDKEETNRRKQHYSLESAVQQVERILFFRRPRPIVSPGFMEHGEVRHMHLGVDDDGKVVMFVTTMRPNETIRVISFRRAHPEERAAYHAYTGYSEPSS